MANSFGPRVLSVLACGLSGLAGVARGQQANLTLSNTTITSGSSTYTATSTITAGPAFTVSGSASVSLVAGNSITLLPGFQATAGSAPVTFQASIGAVPDFSVAVAPASATVTAGGSATYTVTVGAINGFSGAVTLGMMGVVGAWATFSPAAVTGPGTSTMTVATQTGLAAGTYSLVVMGTSGALTHSAAAVSLVVQSGDLNYTFAPVQPSMSVAAGGVAVYQVAAQPAGYTGTITLDLPSVRSPQLPMVSCDGAPNWNGFGLTVMPQGTTPDGSAALLYVSTLSSIGGNGCNSQSYTINYMALGTNPPVAQQWIQMHLTVGITPSFTLAAIPQSQTALSQTYLVMAQSPNLSGPVAFSLNAGSCAYLIGNPVLTLPAEATGTAPVVGKTTVAVGTVGCAPGMTTNLTFTATAAGAAAVTATVGLTTLTRTAMLSPPPGTMIPGGATTFTWQTGPGVTQTMLSVGSSPGAADFYAGSAQTGTSAAVSVPAWAATAYATPAVSALQ